MCPLKTMITQDFICMGMWCRVLVSPKCQMKHDNQTRKLWSKGSFDHRDKKRCVNEEHESFEQGAVTAA